MRSTRRKGQKSESASQIVLVIFTDGRANVSLGDGRGDKFSQHKKFVEDEIVRVGAAIHQAGVTSIVIDTQQRFTSRGEGQFLAEALGGRYLFLPPSVTAHSITEALRQD